MFNFDVPRYEKVVNGAISLRKDIEQVVDGICQKGFKNLYLIGIGGTYLVSVVHTRIFFQSNT